MYPRLMSRNCSSIKRFNSPCGVSPTKSEKESIFPSSITKWLDLFLRTSGS